MGNECLTSSDPRNKEIDKILRQQAMDDSQETKLLLLGAGESGKSTFFKQMRLLSDADFSRAELDSYARATRTALLSSVLSAPSLIWETVPSLRKEEIVRLGTLSIGDLRENMQEDLVRLLSKICSSEEYTDLARLGKVANPETVMHFGKQNGIWDTSWVPTREDVLWTRIRTTGIEEADFELQDFRFTLIDVGGQRSERRKWIHCFDQVTSVIFFTSLAGFDSVLLEDGSTNRMVESLGLFRDISTSVFFSECSIILFLNKSDLFSDKIKRGGDIREAFPDFRGESSVEEEVYNFVESKFLRASGREKNSYHPIYPYRTIAVDTENIRRVFDSARDTVLRTELKGYL